MTKEELFAAIGELDESLLDENVQQVGKKHSLRIFAAIAACAVIGVGAFILPRLTAPPIAQLGTEIPTEETTEQTTETTEAAAVETAVISEFSGFLDGILYYPLPEGSAPDTVSGTDWMAPLPERSAYFVVDEAWSMYQIIDPLSSAMPETGGFMQEGDKITAVSQDGTQSHILRLYDDFAFTLEESTNWENLTGRVFTARIDEANPLAGIDPTLMDSFICNGWDIVLDDAQRAELAALLEKVVRYQEVNGEEMQFYGGRHLQFQYNGDEIRLDHYCHTGGRLYLLDNSSCDAVFDYLEPFVEQARLDWEEDAKALPYQSNVTYGTPAEALSLTIGLGNYTIECSDGRTESGIYYIKDGILYCVYGEEEHEFAVVDDYTIELQKTTQFGEFVGSQLTCRLHPVQPFAELTEDTIVIAQYLAEEISLRITPDTKIMTAFVDALQKLVIYDTPLYSVTPETTDLSQATIISITREDGTTELDIADYLLLDGVGYVYDTASAADLLGIIERVRNGELMEMEAETMDETTP